MSFLFKTTTQFLTTIAQEIMYVVMKENWRR